MTDTAVLSALARAASDETLDWHRREDALVGLTNNATPEVILALVAVAEAARWLDARFFGGGEDWSERMLPGEVDDVHDALAALEALP